MAWLTFEPLIPSSLWVGLALGGIALLVWYAMRKPGAMSGIRWAGTVALMAIAVAVVLGILLNPTWVDRLPPPPGKPLLTVLVDESASMATPDAAQGGTRYQAAGTLAARLARQMGGRFEVRVKAFAGATSSISAQQIQTRQPSGQSTDLAAAVASSFEEDRPQGQAVVLLSDGIHNAGGGVGRVLDAVRIAKAGAVPVYTRTFGGDSKTWDVAVELRSPQDLSFIGQKVPVSVRVKYQGVADVKVNVVLLEAGKEIARREVSVMPQGTADVHFMVSQAKVGLYTYEVKAEPLQGENSQANNSASYLLRVVDEPIRVLVLEGKPYWDAKFLLRTLTADPAVALDSVVRLAEGRLIRRTLSRTAGTGGKDDARQETWKILNDPGQVLASPDSLRAYQIVVLGRDAEVFLTDGALANLQAWIAQDGGSLVCYRGSPASQVNQKLARMLPVKWVSERESRFRVKFTDQGRDLRWLGESGGAEEVISNLPALVRMERVDQSKPLAVVLATSISAAGQENPVVVYQPYGAGRCVVLEGAGMWRWAFLPPQYQPQEEVYSTLWHSLLRWLISGASLLPGQKMSLRSDKVTFNAAESASATLLVKEDAGKSSLPKVELIAEGAKEGKLFTPAAMGEDPGSYRLNFGKLPEGRYQARVVGAKEEDASLRTAFDVKVFGEEQLNLQARPDLMARIASDTGAMVLADDVADQIEKHFREHMARSRPEQVRRDTAWDRWWMFAAVLGLWGLSWAVRRSGGLT